MGFQRSRGRSSETPVELRFADLLLIIIATMMFVAVVLTVTSAFGTRGASTVAEPRVVTTSPPLAVTGVDYTLSLAAAGGDGIYRWQLADGRMPDGLALSEDGLVRGRPTRPQVTQATVRVTDGQERASDRALSFEVRALAASTEREATPLLVEAGRVVLPGAVRGQPYSHTFAADLGQAPYRWEVRRGDLPEGLQLTDDGELTGRPDESGVTTFAVEVTDAAGTTALQRVRMEVASPPQSFVRRALGWAWTAITFLGYFLVAMVVRTILFGAPGHEGTVGVIDVIRARRQMRRMYR